jgi:hypothetical protein
MGRKKIVQTIDTIMARTDEVGDCLEWQGIMANNSTPQIRIDRKLFSVRRVIREMIGNAAKPGNFLAVSCGNPKCVKPDHIIERTPQQHMTAMAALVQHNHPIRIAKLQKAKRHERVVSDEGLLLIRTDSRKAEDVARELGVSKSLVNRIRRGDCYREVRASNNPFAGLMR